MSNKRFSKPYRPHHYRPRRRSFWRWFYRTRDVLVVTMLLLAGITALVSWLSGSDASSPASAYYRYCSDARAAGAAPLYRGEPGYRLELDADGDGVACEPYPGN